MPPDATSGPARTHFAKAHPKIFLALEAAAGILLAIGSLWAFIAIADEVPENGALVRYDLVIEAWLQRTGSETGETIFTFVSWLGAPVLAAVLVGAIVFFARRREWIRAGAVACAGGGATLLNYGLKTLFHRGRPEYAAEFIHGNSWSFPSGHAMDSLVGYGFLVFLLMEHIHTPWRRRLLIGSTLVLVLVIGFSRMYLGVHYMSDVAGGYLAGTVWLMACIAGYEFAELRLPQNSQPEKIRNPKQTT